MRNLQNKNKVKLIHVHSIYSGKVSKAKCLIRVWINSISQLLSLTNYHNIHQIIIVPSPKISPISHITKAQRIKFKAKVNTDRTVSTQQVKMDPQIWRIHFTSKYQNYKKK